ncbi:probable serine/threonine-protein kinase PBL12 [Humulus lupulus]|uniref:probable serine/threonine-protein kinase PBL12 n=1 Tax=Humulus lupulus TaxID=3486 RepID=UPI002B40B5BC|nr:probable serine/threonine-protein kinase PBL12 [Humulus lupulus]
MESSSSSSNLVVFTSEDLKSLTNCFNQKNLIGVTQFGKLYWGCIKKPGLICTENRDVTVKIWDEKSNCLASDDEYLMIKEEVKFLTHSSIHCHPNLVKLVGFCCEKEVRGVVYDLNPRGTLHNIILKDDLSWTQRVNIILQLAGVLEFLHAQDKPYLVLNICGSHIMLDWDCNLKLCDFGLISGGIIGEISDLKKQITMPIGYVDPFFAAKGGYWQTGCDVFSFGVILLGLISTRVLDLEKLQRPELIPEHMVQIWAKNEYRPNCSLVHKSLSEDWGYHTEDGSTLTELGMRCIEFFPMKRPTMKDVIERLKGLMVIQRLGDTRPNKREKKFHTDFDMTT